MQQLVGNTHLVMGGTEVISEVLSLLESVGIVTNNNPDVSVREYKHFGVDEALDLHTRSRSRGLNGRRVFIVVAPSFTSEAQNSLLKTIEEPVADALFFFCVQSPYSMLSTVRSRSQVLKLTQTTSVAGTVDVLTFLKSPPSARVELLKPLLEKGSDDTGKRDIGGIIEFLSALERSHSLYQDVRKERTLLTAVYSARKYISDKGALVKPLLESVALLAPSL